MDDTKLYEDLRKLTPGERLKLTMAAKADAKRKKKARRTGRKHE